MAKIIGQLIDDVVRRQGLSVQEFAERIPCSRQNAYDLFKRSTIDVTLLLQISKALDHNFFLDIIENPELVDITNPEVKKDFLNRRAVAQFFEVMPIVLKKLGIETSIVKPIMKNDFEDPLPDYGLSDFAIFFTVGERLVDRFNPERLARFAVQNQVAYKNHTVDVWHTTDFRSWFVDVKLDYKTEQEWGEIIVYLLNNCELAIKMR